MSVSDKTTEHINSKGISYKKSIPYGLTYVEKMSSTDHFRIKLDDNDPTTKKLLEILDNYDKTINNDNIPHVYKYNQLNKYNYYKEEKNIDKVDDSNCNIQKDKNTEDKTLKTYYKLIL